MIDTSNETNPQYKFQFFANHLSANVKLKKLKIIQPGGFSDNLPRPLPQICLKLMKNVLLTLAKSTAIQELMKIFSLWEQL